MMERASILNPTRAANSPETIQSNDVHLENPRIRGEAQEIEEDGRRYDERGEKGEARHPRDHGFGHLLPKEGVDEEADCGKYGYEPDIVSHLLVP